MRPREASVRQKRPGYGCLAGFVLLWVAFLFFGTLTLGEWAHAFGWGR